MSPNPGQVKGEPNNVQANASVSPELMKKALSMAKRLNRRENEVVKIGTLLSSLRRDPHSKCYETVSDNVNHLLGVSLRDDRTGPTTKFKVYSYSEMDKVVSQSSSYNDNLKEDLSNSLKREDGQTPVHDQGCNKQADSNKGELGGEDLGFVRVFGWVKNLRKQDGGKLLFVILNDGSCKSNVQVIVHKDALDYPEVVKTYVGSSVLVSGFLIDRNSQTSNPSNDTNNNQCSNDGSTNKNERSNHKTDSDNNNKDDGNEKEWMNRENYELLESVSNKFEIHVTRHKRNYLKVLGGNLNVNKYPIAQSKITLEYLRENAHLRARTYTISSVMRVRNSLAVGVHLFFQSLGLNYLNSPIITGSDCEGAGELFQITTLFENTHNFVQLSSKMGYNDTFTYPDDLLNKDNANNNDNKDNENNKEQRLTNSENKDKDTKDKENKENKLNGVYVRNNKINYKNDFFKKKSYLTCSGQLSAENYCCSMGSVYTFGPTFRAENSHTNRHLAEFWMIEPEFLLFDLADLMDVSEKFVKFLVEYVLRHNYDDLHYLNNQVDNSLLERLNGVLAKSFVHLSYTEVIEILKEHVSSYKDNSDNDASNNTNNNSNDNNDNNNSNNKDNTNSKDNDSNELSDRFEYSDIHWGMDLQSEHERFICEKVFNCPVIIYNYPKKIKAFYMRLNEDSDTVAAMDLIIPKIGELIGGSQREERLDYLVKSIKDNNLNEKDYWWYLDLRRFGTVPHSGFGLGFERLVMMMTGIGNIRDVIPFPRYPGHSSF